MFYLIMCIPFAAAFAALQVMLCEKAKKNVIKLLPVFVAALALLLAAFIRGENLLADAVYAIFGQGIFALIVLLWILGGALAAGSVIGFAIYLVKNRK